LGKGKYEIKIVFLITGINSQNAAREAAEAAAWEAAMKAGMCVLGFVLAQLWSWCQVALGKWAHDTLNHGNSIFVLLLLFEFESFENI
jgi:hypothetical protein